MTNQGESSKRDGKSLSGLGMTIIELVLAASILTIVVYGTITFGLYFLRSINQVQTGLAVGNIKSMLIDNLSSPNAWRATVNNYLNNVILTPNGTDYSNTLGCLNNRISNPETITYTTTEDLWGVDLTICPTWTLALTDPYNGRTNCVNPGSGIANPSPHTYTSAVTMVTPTPGVTLTLQDFSQLCPATTGTPLPIAFKTFYSNGNLLYDATNPASGFTLGKQKSLLSGLTTTLASEPTSCLGFDSVNGNDICPLRYEMSVVAVDCDPTRPCVPSLVKITGKAIYKPSIQTGNKNLIRTKDYDFTIFRNAY